MDRISVVLAALAATIIVFPAQTIAQQRDAAASNGQEPAPQQRSERAAESVPRDAQSDTSEAREEQSARRGRREQRRDEGVEARRSELIRDADEALETLRGRDQEAAQLIDDAYGHAVFRTTKGGLLVTGAGGSGVAREAESGEATFMHLGSAGVGLGAGVENYLLVLLLADEEAYRRFVTGQWDGSLSAQAAAGGVGAAAEEPFLESVRVYRVTDRGVMAQVDATGTRFWVSRRLNDEDTLERIAAIDDELDEADRREAEQQVAAGEDERVVR